VPRYGESHSRTRFPSTPAELAASLADPAEFARMFPSERNPGAAWTDFTTSYIEANSHLKDLINAEIETGQYLQFRDQALSGRLNELGRRFRPGDSVTGQAEGRRPGRVYNRFAPGTAAEGIMPHSDWPLSDFFRLITRDPEQRGDTARVELKNRLLAAQAKVYGKSGEMVRIRGAMSERVPAEGGFLVPENLRDDLLTVMLEQSEIRGRAHVVPMDSLRVPWPTIDDTSHTSTVYGGVSAVWTEEGGALTASAPAFARIVLEARKLTSFTSIPNELLQDASPTIEAFITETWPAAMAWFEDLAFIRGSGVGEPQGILNSPAAVTVPCSTTAHVLDWTAVVTMWSRLLPQCFKSDSLVWLAAPDVIPGLLQLAANATVTTSGTTQIAPPLMLSGMQGIGSPPAEMLGRPIIYS
jgi:HK97 family phage major capsid protein